MNPAAALGEDISGGALQPPDVTGGGESVAVLAFPSLTNPSFVESTILRIRGTLSVPKSFYSTSAGGNEVFAFGIGLISDQAAEVVTAIPNPATATGYDWDGWLFLRQAGSAPVDPAGEIVDIKAMRKWRGGDSIVFVAGLATGASEVGQPFTMSLRGLFLLP